jgi:hypothetical protein
MDPVNGFDPSGLFTDTFGLAVHAEVGVLYEAEFPASAGFVSFGTPVNDVGIWPGLKPDIF